MPVVITVACDAMNSQIKYKYKYKYEYLPPCAIHSPETFVIQLTLALPARGSRLLQAARCGLLGHGSSAAGRSQPAKQHRW